MIYNQGERQIVPIKVYQSDDQLTLAAPMPGLETEDIHVKVTAAGQVVIDGRLRGTLKGSNSILVDEWNPGQYYREYDLPQAVDGAAANVTYGNGVVVVALPLSPRMQAANIELVALPHARSVHAGHSGKSSSNLIDTATEQNGSSIGISNL
jgi:HSP20 family protein